MPDKNSYVSKYIVAENYNKNYNKNEPKQNKGENDNIVST